MAPSRPTSVDENGIALEFLRAMARNNAWANHRLYRACAQLDSEALKAECSGFFPSIFLTLSHIYLVDLYYLDALHEEGQWEALYAMPEEPFDGFASLRDAQQGCDGRLIAFCQALAPQDLERQVMLFRPGDQRYAEAIPGVLLHLFQHQIHHRGQAHAMLSSTPVAPPQLDEFFLRQDGPRRSRDLAEMGWPSELHTP